jgi:4-aminobutyrate aminotransferase-like enzyme
VLQGVTVPVTARVCVGCVQAGLIDRLLRIVPSNLQRFFFANSGSEAVDNAIKVARGHTGKQNIIAFEVCLLES